MTKHSTVLRVRMTYTLAMAASRDAANRNMRKNGRVAWNDEDWNVACALLDALIPEEIRGEIDIHERSGPR